MTGPVRAARDLLQEIAETMNDAVLLDFDAVDLRDAYYERCHSVAASLGPSVVREDVAREAAGLGPAIAAEDGE